ncbi:MAG: hypothetical protein AAF432_11540 [Planctomycetota bacterium]
MRRPATLLGKDIATHIAKQRQTEHPQRAAKALDDAVIAAYAAIEPDGEWSPSWAEVFVETSAGQPLPKGHELSSRRAEIEQLILGKLLRMNLERLEPT